MRTRTQTFTKPVQVLVIFALILTLLIPLLIPQTAGAGPKVQPQLLQIVEEDPHQTVRLIVQKADDSPMAVAMAKRLGANVLTDLSMIHAFVVTMEASQAVKLSKSPYVNWVSLDGKVEGAGKPPPKDSGSTAPTTNTYLDTLGVRDVWAMGYDGQGIGIALIDSGAQHPDFDANIAAAQAFNVHSNIEDFAGHGTHVAGIIVGSGAGSKGDFAGVAPGASLIALNVSQYNGSSFESDVVAAMQWVYDNKDAYNIRVVNLSINSTVASSYHESPMDAAAEILWFNGIVVVASAGNSGTSAPIDTIQAAPANDPFIITVGATDEHGTTRKQDDTVPTFSASGKTLEGYWKPDVYAPGVNIISTLANMSMWEYQYPDRKITTKAAGVEYEYFRASGTSMAAPMVSGAAALLLQAEPNLTPDQVKYRLTWAGTVIDGDAYLDVYEALTWHTYDSANTGLEASQLLWTGDEPVVWSSVAWNSVAWNSVAWNSVAWNSVAWNSVAWNSVAWNE